MGTPENIEQKTSETHSEPKKRSCLGSILTFLIFLVIWLAFVFGVSCWAHMSPGSWLRYDQQKTFRTFKFIESSLKSYHKKHDRYPKILEELSAWKNESAKKDSPAEVPQKKADPAETKTTATKPMIQRKKQKLPLHPIPIRFKLKTRL